VIVKKLELGAFAANCFIVGDEETKEGMIIDPAADGNSIMKNVNALGLKIKMIVLTHSHMDHIGALAEVKEKTGAPLAIHAEEAASLKSPQFRMIMAPFSKRPPPADIILKDGDTINIGKLSFKVLHTPGHTPGGISLYTKGIVFTGDTLFNFGIGRADFPGSNYEQELESISKRLMPLPDNTIVCPGHGPDSTIGVERRGNPFLNGEM
jgi:hydroxyacylglutathione hydrolase